MKKNDVINFLIIFMAVLFLELTVFNFHSYRVFNSKNSKTFKENDFNYIQNDEVTVVEISNINTEIKTLHIEVNNYDNIAYELLYTDQTTSNYKGTASKNYIENLNNSKYIATYLSRKQ